MKKIIIYFLMTSLTSFTVFSQETTGTGQIFVNIDTLSVDENNLMPTTGSIVLIADTAGDGFQRVGIPSLTTGNFSDTIGQVADDLIIGVFSSNYYGFGGVTVREPSTVHINNAIPTSSYLSTGDALAIAWFPTVAPGASVQGGDAFGFFYDVNVFSSFQDGDPSYYQLAGTGSSSIVASDWVVPGLTGDTTLNFFTDNRQLAEYGYPNGDVPASFGYASFTAIPEPSTYAALLGAVGLIYVGYRRRKNKAAA